MPSACGPIILQKSQLEKRPHRRIATKDKQLGNTALVSNELASNNALSP
jgi:hypothetical protein